MSVRFREQQIVGNSGQPAVFPIQHRVNLRVWPSGSELLHEARRQVLVKQEAQHGLLLCGLPACYFEQPRLRQHLGDFGEIVGVIIFDGRFDLFRERLGVV